MRGFSCPRFVSDRKAAERVEKMNKETENYNSDDSLVAGLLRNETAAWTVFEREVSGFLRKNAELRDILRKTSHPHDEFFNELYIHLMEEDGKRLRGFSFKGSFRQWLRAVERTVLQNLVGSKFRREVEVVFDHSQTSDDSEGAANPELTNLAYIPPVPGDAVERLNVTRSLMARLMREDPVGAHILVMKYEAELPSSVIGELLGLTPCNVDVKASRAKEWLRREEAKIV